MYFTAKESTSLSWLKAALGEQRNVVAGLLRRLTGLSASRGLKPSAFRKFMKMLEQISVEKDIENEIVSRIQAIELHHRDQRRSRRLKPARCALKISERKELEVEYPEPKPVGDDLPWILAILFFISRRGPRLEE